MLLADFTQSFEVPHLPNGRAPLYEEPLMQAPTLLKFGRPSLESNRVARHSSKVLIVEPTDRFLVGLHADSYALFLGSGLSFKGGRIAATC